MCMICTHLQIYIGGDSEGLEMLADDPGAPRDPNWTLNPGAVIEEACLSDFKAIHMTGICISFVFNSTRSLLVLTNLTKLQNLGPGQIEGIVQMTNVQQITISVYLHFLLLCHCLQGFFLRVVKTWDSVVK